jgi:hypothetical protein
MSDEELAEANERLANPPVVDFALSRMLGLYVVARLAERYDVKVQLRHSWYGGITALVLLPPTVAVRAPMPEAIEAPSRRGPAELVPSTKPVEPAAEETVETGDHLPIFEAARSDWFEDSVRGDHLPLRRHAAQQPNGRAAEPTGNGVGTLSGADAARTPGAAPGGFGFDASRPAGSDDPTRPQPDGDGNQADRARTDAARTDAARAEAMRVEAMRIEAARMEAAGAEAARTEAAPEQAARAEAPAPPTARTGRPPADGEGARALPGPLPTRIPGAAGPPPGGAIPFAPAGPPPAPTPPPQPSRSSRRAARAGADRGAASDRASAGPAATAPAAGPTRVPGPAPGEPAATPAPAPATLQAASVQTTKAGLPRRVPRANLAPGMVAAQTAAPAARPPDDSSQPSTSAARSPEEVRSMLSSYRSGLERGRMMAAGEDADRGGDAHSSSRSDDDDATQ